MLDEISNIVNGIEGKYLGIQKHQRLESDDNIENLNPTMDAKF